MFSELRTFINFEEIFNHSGYKLKYFKKKKIRLPNRPIQIKYDETETAIYTIKRVHNIFNKNNAYLEKDIHHGKVARFTKALYMLIYYSATIYIQISIAQIVNLVQKFFNFPFCNQTKTKLSPRSIIVNCKF